MTKQHLIIVLIISSQIGFSQIYEVGVFSGGANFIGDVGATTFIAPENFTFGGIIRWNRSPRHSFRASVIYSSLHGDDRLSNDPKRLDRGYFFESNVFEISTGMEFTFFDFDLHREDFNFSPYIYTGISFLNHPNFYFDFNGFQSEGTRSNAVGIPIALGLKITLNRNLILGSEIGARYTLSDEIDGSESDAEELHTHKFGNFNNNDWYVFSGITLTYTFGKDPCFCSY